MSKVNPISISNLSDVPTLIRFLSPFCNQIQTALANGLNFNDNFVSSLVPVYFGSTISKVIIHGLPVTPTGYLVVQYSAPFIIYNGSSLVLGASFANLRSNVAGVSALIMFF